jgi:hypothetical protein
VFFLPAAGLCGGSLRSVPPALFDPFHPCRIFSV